MKQQTLRQPHTKGSAQELPSRIESRAGKVARDPFPSPIGFNALRTPHSVFPGDCLDVLGNQIPAETVDLVFTSPPYADQRKSSYGGMHPDDYVDWFLPRAEKIKSVLKLSGSFVLNIKEKAVNGERHPYVLNLILGMREQGWLWTEEYLWHKKNCYLGKWPNRFRDGWERILHFTRSRRFKMNQEAVMIPMGDWAKGRLKNLSETDRSRDPSKNENGFGKRVSNWIDREYAYPTNVLHMATECGYKGHPATFPVELPSWFIKLFTDIGDTVLDPYAGSGTTSLAAKELQRCSMAIEIQKDFCNTIKERLLHE